VNIVQIIPAPARGGSGLALTNGTKVVLSDGSELQGVLRVTIVGDRDSLWKATIECLCQAPEFDAIQAQIALTAEPVTWTEFQSAVSLPRLTDIDREAFRKDWGHSYCGEPYIPRERLWDRVCRWIAQKTPEAK
jgi:hypothetical protein